MASSEVNLSSEIQALFYSAHGVVDRGRAALDTASRTMYPLFFVVRFGNTGQPERAAWIRADATLALSGTRSLKKFTTSAGQVETPPEGTIVSVVTLTKTTHPESMHPTSHRPALSIGRENGPGGKLHAWVALPAVSVVELDPNLTRGGLSAEAAVAALVHQTRLRVPLAEYAHARRLTTGLVGIFGLRVRRIWSFGSDPNSFPRDAEVQADLTAASRSSSRGYGVRGVDPYQRIP